MHVAFPSGADCIDSQTVQSDYACESPAVWHWLQQSVDPVRGRRELCILRRLVLRLDPVTRQCAWYWRRADSGQPERMRQQPDLLAPLLDPSVLALFGNRLLQDSGNYDRLRMPTMQACQEVMEAHLCADPELANWQQDWHRALSACQPRVLALAQHACLDARDGISPALYKLVWRYEELFLDVGENAPQLSPLLAIVLATGRELEVSNGALQALRTMVCELPGCGPASWRWLLKWGIGPLGPFIRPLVADQKFGRAWEVAADFLSLWSRADCPPALPESVSLEWAGRIGRFSEFGGCCPERVAVVAEHAAKLSSGEAKHQACEIADILEHAAEPLPLMDRNQKRSGWSWLRRECSDKTRGVSVNGETLARIRDQLPSLVSISGFDLVVLKDEQAILEEGRMMDHCMELTPLLYINDGQLHFSVRCLRSGRRVATCSLDIGQVRSVVTEVLGPGNQPAPKLVRRVAERLVSHPDLMGALRELI